MPCIHLARFCVLEFAKHICDVLIVIQQDVLILRDLCGCRRHLGHDVTSALKQGERVVVLEWEEMRIPSESDAPYTVGQVRH